MKYLWKLLISLTLVLVAVPMSGQVNLQTWVKKAESIESVDITVITKKNPNTGKLEQDLTTISFKNNASLLNDLVAAYKKDEEKAYEMIKNRKGGKDIPQILSFMVDGVDTKYIFSDLDKDKTTTVTIIVKESGKKSHNITPVAPLENTK